MGMYTEITGHFSFNKPVDEELKTYVNKFSGIRHMIRDVKMIKGTIPDWESLSYRGDLGEKGEFYVGEEEDTVIDANDSGAVPSLNCGWIISDDGNYLEASYAAYGYLYMLRYLIVKFFEPNGYILNGTVDYEDETGDEGEIIINDNVVDYTGGICGNDYWPSTSFDVLEKYGCSSDDYHDELGAYSGNDMLYWDSKAGSPWEYEAYPSYSEIMLVLNKKDPKPADYRKFAEKISDIGYLHPVSISQFLCDVVCRDVNNNEVKIAKKSYVLFAYCYTDEKNVDVKGAKVVIPQYGVGFYEYINDKEKLKYYPEGEDACATDVFVKRKRIHCDFGFISAEYYAPMKIHSKMYEIEDDSYAYTNFADRDNDDEDFFDGFDSKPRKQREVYLGCGQYMFSPWNNKKKYADDFCVKLYTPESLAENLFSESMRELLCGRLQLGSYKYFDEIDSLMESAKISVKKGSYDMRMSFESTTDIVKVAYSDTEDGYIIAEEFCRDSFTTRTAYFVDRSVGYTEDRIVLGNDSTFGSFKKNLQAFADAYARKQDGLPIFEDEEYDFDDDEDADFYDDIFYADEIPFEKRNDKEYVISVVKGNGYSLKYADESLCDDEDVVLAAVASNGIALRFASARLRDNEDIVWIAIHNSGDYSPLEFVSERLCNDRDIVLASLRCCDLDDFQFNYVGDKLREDEDFIRTALKIYPYGFNFVDEKYRDDKDLILECIAKNGRAFRYASDRLKDDKDVVLSLVNNCNNTYGFGETFKLASERLRDDPEIIIPKSSDILKYASDSIKGNRETVLSFAKNIGRILGFINENFRDDKEIVLADIAHFGGDLEFASERLRDDIDVVKAAVSANTFSIQYAGNIIRNDKALMFELLDENRGFGGSLLAYAGDELKADKDFVNAVIIKSGTGLKYADNDLLNDKKIVMGVVSKYGMELEYASPKLQDDREVVLSAVNCYGFAVQFASERLKNDIEIALAAVNKYPWAFSHLGESMKKNKEVVRAAVSIDGDALDFADESLKKDKELIDICVTTSTCNVYIPSEKFRNDRDFLLDAIESNDDNFPIENKDFRNDKGFILEAVSRNGYVLSKLTKKWTDDEDIVMAAVACDPDSIKFASERLRDAYLDGKLNRHKKSRKLVLTDN